MLSLFTADVAETVALGERLGRLLVAGDFVALSGELGAGKTCFARGVAAGLGVPSGVCVTSPTYTLMNSYAGRLILYHFDLYRLSTGEATELGFDEYFHGGGVCLVEWAERLGPDLPADLLLVSFSHEDECRRRLEFSSFGQRGERIIRDLVSGAEGVLLHKENESQEF